MKLHNTMKAICEFSFIEHHGEGSIPKLIKQLEEMAEEMAI